MATGTSALQAIFARISARQDLILVMLLVTTIFMMILPMPTWLVDFLIGTNMSITVLLLLVGVYLKSPLDFSTLPSVILISTLFRLSLSITTTRLILTTGDAGSIVQTFGEFVIAGNIIVGLVVFLIITVVQFVVITKGSERIAEVSARFSLDALPGKQMSIDSDMRSGSIDLAEARRRRNLLERESQLFGAMDGAMKFVKGDAIAGLVIIVVNLLGGIAIGAFQRGMSMGEAAQVYTLLTVGDGLVSQIPALFLSITAGTIITRVASDESVNLGTDISNQILNDPKSLQIAALVLLFFAFIPGFPTAIFLFLAAAFGGVGFMFYWRERQDAEAVSDGNEQAILQPRSLTGEALELPPSAPVTVEIAANLIPLIDVKRFASHTKKLREALYNDLGVPFPEVALRADESFEDHAFRISIEEIPVTEGELPADKLYLRDDPSHLELLDISYTPDKPLTAELRASWVDVEHRAAMRKAGISFMEPSETLAYALGSSLSRHASQFLGIQEARAIIAGMESHYTDLVKEAQKVLPLQKMAEVFRRLVDEGISIRNMRIVLEALVEWGQKEKDVVLLAEYVRSALKRQISYKFSNEQKIMPAFMLERDVEETIRSAIRHTSVGSYLSLDNGISQTIISQLRHTVGDPASHQTTPVVLASLDIRRFVRNLLTTNDLDLPVLSYQDVAQEVTVQPLGSISMNPPQLET